METIWTTGPQGKWKKCIYLSSYKMMILANRERAVQWEFTDYSFLESIMLKSLCKKISKILYCTLSTALTGKLWAALLYNLGTGSYCIWSWELSIFNLFVFKSTPSIFTSSTLAFNTFIEKSNSQKKEPSSVFFCYNFEQKGHCQKGSPLLQIQQKKIFVIWLALTPERSGQKSGVICWNAAVYIHARCLDYFYIQLAETALLRSDSAD